MLAKKAEIFGKCKYHPDEPVLLACILPNCPSPLFCGECAVSHEAHLKHIRKIEELIGPNVIEGFEINLKRFTSTGIDMKKIDESFD